MNGVVVLDKPQGPTSFDMVARVRRAASERRVGHAGTLDPMATGVLLLCLGEATKLVPFLMDADKEYAATLRLGVRTDSDDAGAGSRVLAEAEPGRVAALSEADIRAALLEQRGLRRQRPPAFSALKVEGERLYDRARAGDDLSAAIEDKAREVRIDDLVIDEIAPPLVRFTVRCGKGTYIRSIARDAGERLGVGAHLTALRRLRVGRFRAEAATPLLSDGDRRDRFDGAPRLFSPEEALAHLPATRLDAALAARLRDGQKVAVAVAARQLGPAVAADYAAALGPAGELIAVLGRGDAGWSIARGFGKRAGT